MAWEQGSFGKEELKKELGLTAGNSSYSTGSSTGVKGNALLGKGYLSESDTKRLLGNSQLKEAFVASGGDPDSYETINDVDTAIDYLTKDKEDTPKKDTFKAPLKEIEVSPRLATARARAAQYEEDRVSGQAAKDLYDPGNNAAEGFLERFKLKLGDRLENGNYRPQ